MSDPKDFDSYQNLNANFEKREVADFDSVYNFNSQSSQFQSKNASNQQSQQIPQSQQFPGNQQSQNQNRKSVNVGIAPTGNIQQSQQYPQQQQSIYNQQQQSQLSKLQSINQPLNQQSQAHQQQIGNQLQSQQNNQYSMRNQDPQYLQSQMPVNQQSKNPFQSSQGNQMVQQSQRQQQQGMVESITSDTVQSVVMGDSFNQSQVINKGDKLLINEGDMRQTNTSAQTPMLDKLSKSFQERSVQQNPSQQPLIDPNLQSKGPQNYNLYNQPEQQQFQAPLQPGTGVNPYPSVDQSYPQYPQQQYPGSQYSGQYPQQQQYPPPQQYPQQQYPQQPLQQYPQQMPAPPQPQPQAFNPQNVYIAQCPFCTAIQSIQSFSAYQCYNCKRIVDNLSQQTQFQCGVCRTIVVYQPGISPMIQCLTCRTVNYVPGSMPGMGNSTQAFMQPVVIIETKKKKY